MSPFISNSLHKWLNEMEDDLVTGAMRRTLERNKTSWNYVKSIMEGYRDSDP